MVDKQLNYGRENIAAFLQMAAPFRTVVDLGAGSGAELRRAALVARRESNLLHQLHRERLRNGLRGFNDIERSEAVESELIAGREIRLDRTTSELVGI